MKFGIFLNSQHAAGEDANRRFYEIVEQVRLARQLGFDSVWGGEHHVTPGYHYFPLLPLLHRLAPEAEGMEIGTNIVLLPMHNPVETAEVAAFLDVVTGGRFQLGVGLGYRPEEFAMFGVPMKERVSRMVEAIEIIRKLWSKDGVSHNGKHWQFEDFSINPKPMQQPGPPILVAAQVEASIKRAAVIADGWAMVPTPRTGQIESEMGLFTETRAAAGQPPAKHFVRLFEVYCAADRETALRKAAPFLLEKYASYMAWGLPGLALDPDDEPTVQLRKLAEDRFGVGAPEDVIKALLVQHRLGVSHVTMRCSWPGMPQEDILANLELLGRDVLPEVRRQLAGSAH